MAVTESRARTVSTGRAAKLCGVKSDTVLKWIKANKIVAARTAGGHFRIEEQSLRPFIAGDPHASADGGAAGIADQGMRRPCWEYCARGADVNVVNSECHECIVFKSKAENCYVLVSLGKKGGHSGVYCKKSCESCRYYAYVREMRSRVLVITGNDELKRNLESVSGETIEVRFACCGYRASALIADFTPDVILVDEKIKTSGLDELCSHLCDDPRLTDSRIFVATEELHSPGAVLPDAAALLSRKSKYIRTIDEYRACVEKRSGPIRTPFSGVPA